MNTDPIAAGNEELVINDEPVSKQTYMKSASPAYKVTMVGTNVWQDDHNTYPDEDLQLGINKCAELW